MCGIAQSNRRLCSDRYPADQQSKNCVRRKASQQGFDLRGKGKF